MSPVTGIQNTKEVFDLVLAGVDVVVKSKEDGKIDARDLQHLFILIPYVQPALDDISEVPAELLDLDTGEGAELLTKVMAKLTVDSARARLIIEKAVKAVVSALELFAAIQAPEDAASEEAPSGV